MYTLTTVTPLTDLSHRDTTMLSIAVKAAQNSSFDNPKRLGACLQGKQGCIL